MKIIITAVVEVDAASLEADAEGELWDWEDDMRTTVEETLEEFSHSVDVKISKVNES